MEEEQTPDQPKNPQRRSFIRRAVPGMVGLDIGTSAGAGAFLEKHAIQLLKDDAEVHPAALEKTLEQYPAPLAEAVTGIVGSYRAARIEAMKKVENGVKSTSSKAGFDVGVSAAIPTSLAVDKALQLRSQRRDFLKTAAAATVGLYTMSHTADYTSDAVVALAIVHSLPKINAAARSNIAHCAEQYCVTDSLAKKIVATYEDRKAELIEEKNQERKSEAIEAGLITGGIAAATVDLAAQNFTQPRFTDREAEKRSSRSAPQK